MVDLRALCGLISGVKAPNFTRENAGAMARLATAARVRNQQARVAQALADGQAREKAEREKLPAPDDARRDRTLKQLDLLDNLVDAALAAGDADRFLQLSQAKDRLWKLVQPTAGALRPSKSGKSIRSGPLAPVGDASEPQPAQPDTTS